MKKLAFVSALALSTLFGTGIASAQDNTYTYAKDSLGGCAADIAASGSEVYKLDCNPAVEKSIWKRTSSGWQSFSSSAAAQIEVSGAGVPWIRKADGKIYRWDGSTFVRVGPTTNCASDFGVGQESGVWELGCNGTTKRVYKWNGSSWIEPQPSARASHIAVGLDNVPWLQVESDTSAWQWNGTSFVLIANDVSVVGGGGWVVGTNGNDIWQWANNTWVYGDEYIDIVSVLTHDGTFAASQGGATLNQSKFESFSIAGDLVVTVRGRYFDPGFTNLVWEKSSNGERVFLKQQFSPDASGVVNLTQALGGFYSCAWFGAQGLRRSSPKQRMWLTGTHNREASMTSDAIKNLCWNQLPL